MKRIIKISDAFITCASSVVGKQEAEGPLGDIFDICDRTDKFGAKTWEQAESAMQKKAFSQLMNKSGMDIEEIGMVFAGDLQNQCVGSSYGLLDFDVPYIGLYGACSTAVEGLMLSAMTCSAGYADTCVAVTSSHYLAAERQYRSPIEYGAQRSPTAQWTVTGSAAFAVGRKGDVRISAVMPGIVVEKGINDASNMGAAMAPAAANTIYAFFKESGHAPEDFDVIATGDLGYEGGKILCELLASSGLDIRRQYTDCGALIYDRIKQDKHAGGSGCGCSAVVLASYFYPRLAVGKIRKMLVIGTGAMMSPSSIQQGLAIPAIGHLIQLEHGRG
ncbi:MAG: stage V sporulation protein AD [Clostridia bacterium]|nr:stage V sporulation protein AD [Clostridia bacterium]